MNVIITGHTGIGKKQLAETLSSYVCQKRGVSPKHEASKGEIAWFEVESKEWLGRSVEGWTGDFLTFISNYNENQQREAWSKSLRAINDFIKSTKPKPKHILLLIHATCYRNGRFFSPVSWDDLINFRPDCIISLTDDVNDTWQRIEDGPHDTHFSLQEILNWRSAEIFYSKALAEDLRFHPDKLGLSDFKPSKKIEHLFGPALPFYFMAVKHPLETFYRLIFERSTRPLVYASFPITRTRGKKDRRADIDEFRANLHDAGAIVIDPLTIDELRMEEDDPEWLKLKNLDTYERYQSNRWPINHPSIEPPVKYSASPFAELTDLQIKSTVTSLFNHVVDRDFRLVSQCNRTIAYRPFYPEKGDERTGPATASSTGGVTREIDFALHLQKSVWAYHPKHDHHSDQDRNFFDDRARWGRITRYPTKSKLKSLPEHDFSGFKDLITDLEKLVKESKP